MNYNLSDLTSVEAEKSVLGAILMREDTLYECADLRPEEFSLDSHRRLYTQMIELAHTSVAIDLITLVDGLTKTKELEKVGGAAYVSSLLDGLPDRPNVEHYIRIVKDLAVRRKFVNLCDSSIGMALDRSETTSDCITVTDHRLLELVGRTGTKPVRVSESDHEMEAYLEEHRKLPMERKAVGFTTSLRDCDEMTTGFRRKELAIIGAFTADGKTSVAIQAALANLREGKPVGYFSLELPRITVMLRFYSIMGQIPFARLRDPRDLDLEDQRRLEIVRKEFEKLPLFIDDTPGLNDHELTSRIKLLARRDDVHLHFVDYIGLMQAQGETKNDQQTKIVTGLMGVSKDEDCAVVGLSQISRPDGRVKRRPSMLDLKDSGAIEQTARLVLMPYRPWDKEQRFTNDDELIVAKQTSGPTGILNVKYNRDYLIFESREESPHRDDN